MQYRVVACNFVLLHAISCCCMQKPNVLSPLFCSSIGVHCNKYPLHAISCCCMQFRVVACNFVLLHAKPRGPPAHTQQQHYPHTNISSYSQLQQQRTAEHVADMPIPQVMWQLSRPPKMTLKNVFLRGFVNMWRTSPLHKSSSTSLLCPRSQARPNPAEYRGTGFSLFW